MAATSIAHAAREVAERGRPDPRAEQQTLPHIVRHEHHRLTESAFEGAEFALQLEPRDGVEGPERLVEE